MASSFENVNDCLICLTESVDVIEIIEKTAGKQDNIGTIISKYFWFEATDYENRKLCTTCWKKIYDFHTFYLEIESLHERDVWQTHQPIVEINMGEIVEPSTVKTEEIKDEFDFDMTHVNIKTECSDELEDKQVNKADKANESEQSDESDSETSEEEQEEEDSVDSDDSDQPLIKRKKSSPKKTTKKSTKKEKEDDLIRKVCPLECDKCKKKFKTFQSLYSHYEKEHDCKGYAMCCTKKFCKKNELLDHVERHENPSKFKCQQCSKVLVSSKSLQSHIKAMHNDEKPYKCEECPKSFIRKSLLDRHKGVHVPVDKREFTCEYCAKKFADAKQFKDHVVEMHDTHLEVGKSNDERTIPGSKKHKCDKCNKSFARPSILKEHQQQKHGGQVEKINYVCETCDIGFPRQNALRKHEKVVHGKAPVQNSLRDPEQVKVDDEYIRESGKLVCETCGDSSFTLFIDVVKHCNTVHNSLGFVKCCGKRFHKRTKLLEHIRWHENPDLNKCQICGKTFGTSGGLMLHMQHLHTAEEEKKFRCENCGVAFPTKQQLTVHMGYHVPESEHKVTCELCNKTFPNNTFLARHNQTHHIKRQHICDICAKTFNRSSDFKRHLKLHSGVREQCPLCHKSFVLPKNLRLHLESHSGEKKHPCDMCDHLSTTVSGLQSHKKRMHFTGRDFVCTYCEKAFKTKITLREHIATHTGEILYSCEFCPRNFISNSNWASHRKNSHPAEWLQDKILKDTGKKPRAHIKSQ